jgi:hypothetical protein
MNEFLDTYNLPKMKKEDIKQLKQIHNEQWNGSSNSLPKKKSIGPEWFCARFYQTFKEELASVPFNLFYKIEK